jgi:hypothetical protein
MDIPPPLCHGHSLSHDRIHHNPAQPECKHTKRLSIETIRLFHKGHIDNDNLDCEKSISEYLPVAFMGFTSHELPLDFYDSIGIPIA